MENYITLLGRLGTAAGPDVVTDTFRLADAIRGRSVQKALSSAGARMTASDPKLSAAVRQEQDLRQQIGTQLGLLNQLLALPSAERDDSGVAAMRKEIEKVRAEHVKVRADIDRRFPDYADLIDPKPPTLAQIRNTLKPGEALLSFYFGRDGSFVWAVAQNGKVEFAASRELRGDRAKDQDATRLAGAAGDDGLRHPRIRSRLAHELYKSLLEPVKAGWRRANSLIMVTNGALGLLPLGVLHRGAA